MGTPFGSPGWVEGAAMALGLEASLRPPGRPRKLEIVTRYSGDHSS